MKNVLPIVGFVTYSGRKIGYTEKDVQRFLSKFDKTEGCWLWNRGPAHLYANFSIKYTSVLAHIFSYQYHVGLIPEGLVLDHLCRNPACINPKHLEPVTQRINTLRGIGVAANNFKKTHCPAGHEYTKENTFIRKCGRRRCITCTNIKQKRVYWQNKSQI